MTIFSDDKSKKAEPPVGAILIVGGGISGMQSALDLANAGFRVKLVENSPSIGGRMAQLDKTFPTNDCSMCIVSPKLVEAGRHKNIDLYTHSELESLEGEIGHFKATIRKRPRYVELNACTGCGLCEIVCPVTCQPYFPEPNEDGKVEKAKKRSDNLHTLAFKNKEIVSKAPNHWHFEVDSEACKKCGICSRRCPVNAIKWEKGSQAEIDQDRCIACGVCFVSCPPKFDAIRATEAPELERSIGAAVVTRSQTLKDKFAEQEGHDCLRCGLCQLMCDKVMDTGAIRLTDKGVEIDRDACRVCGACVNVCPVEFIPLDEVSDKEARPLRSEFNERLAPRKPIFIKYPQAVPRVPVIDESACVRLNAGACGTCQSMCDANAINYTHEEVLETVDVGSVILSPGYEVFDAEKRLEFGYGVYPNVMTSLEFERLLSASGPTSGAVLRPSDGKHPKRIAWIQCVGSRDVTCDRDYCSSVCCMYATKEAFIAKEHDGNIEPTIFYIDLRAFGKNFDAYVQRAKDHHGVRYVRAIVSRVFDDPQSHDLELRYIDEEGHAQREIFDMVVLSVGLQIQEETKQLATRLGVDMDNFGFAKTDTFKPLATNRPGVFVSGVFNGPKDIPETVSEASGAAGAAAAFLHGSRGTLVTKEVFPTERSMGEGEAPRIGVFVCHCGINIASVVDVAEVVEYAKGLPGVVYAEHPLYTCSQDTQERIRNLIEEKNLTHIVVAACSPRTHEPVFQETMRQAGLNRYMFDMANIRDQCSWVHQNDHAAATQKSRRLVSMAIANVLEAEPLAEHEFGVSKNLLVVGGGVAGMTAALQAAEQGFHVFLVEREQKLGGHMRNLRYTTSGESIADYLEELEVRVRSHQNVRVFAGSEIVSQSGFVGNFETEIMIPTGDNRMLQHGASIIATGAHESRPEIYGLGEDARVISQSEFETKLASGDGSLNELGHIVMIQCAGSRDDDHLPYCSRVCCNQAIKNALRFKESFPKARVDVLYRDIRSYGHGELAYRQARRARVNFIRYEPETNPIDVQLEGEKLFVSLRDPSIRRRVKLEPDLLVLSTGVEANDTEELAGMLRVPRNDAGFFFEAHAKLRPVDFASEGLFLAGTAHGPKTIPETISQAQAAVARAATILSKDKLRMSGIVSQVDPEHCAVCLTCVRACPYGIPFVNEDHTAEINPALCQGCGICVAECPAKTIHLGRYRDENIYAKIYAFGKMNEANDPHTKEME